MGVFRVCSVSQHALGQRPHRQTHIQSSSPACLRSEGRNTNRNINVWISWLAPRHSSRDAFTDSCFSGDYATSTLRLIHEERRGALRTTTHPLNISGVICHGCFLQGVHTDSDSRYLLWALVSVRWRDSTPVKLNFTHSYLINRTHVVVVDLTDWYGDWKKTVVKYRVLLIAQMTP